MKIITIEGNDGTGKRTQSELLLARLRKQGYNVEMISFPDYGSPGCKGVESYLQKEIDYKDNVGAITILYCADRIYTMNKYKEKFDKLDFLICDRYVTSNILHQAVKYDDWNELEVAIHNIKFVEYEIAKLPKPDCVVYLHLEAETSSVLRKERGRVDIHEDDLNYMERVQDMGHFIATMEDWKMIEKPMVNLRGELRSKESISDDIYAIVEREVM